MNLIDAAAMPSSSGMIDLGPLLAPLAEANVALGALDPNTPQGRAYTRKASQLVASAPETAGFYLWGAHNAEGLWNSIYLGKAGHGRASNLRARLLEELRDERCCMVEPLLGREVLMTHGERLYPNMWQIYRKHWERSLLKTGTTHIAWVAMALAPEQISDVEACLIEVFQPRANRQRPAPRVECRSITNAIEVLMRAQVSRASPSRPKSGSARE
ncbi:MAG: hypothetical protein LCH59_11080 [Proteobacteria bacterium]|jgi:hypothetical protein|nr:hypothetical protein [Pseudomonadota bacterium]